MGNCKDCKHWKLNADHSGKQYHTCEMPDWVAYDTDIGADGFAVYVEADNCTFGIDSGVKTGPLFGCVRFEQCTT